jgi:hypothetical protein
MITYESNSKPLWIAAGVLVSAAAVAAVWWSMGGSQPADGGVSSGQAAASGVSAWFQKAPSDQPEAALTAATAEDGRPMDVEAGDWAVLNAALLKYSYTANDAKRITDFLRYQRAFEAWQNLDETKDAARRLSMARALYDELPEKLRSGDFVPVEANLMGAVLIAEIEKDENKRQQKLEALQAQLNQIMPITDNEQAMLAQNRKVEAQRRLTSAFSDWQLAQNPTDRTPAKLEQAFAEARRATNSGE